RRMARSFGALAHTGTTCGCHVHVAIPDRETGVRVANHARPWLPVLLALTANSPFHDGEDTGYASWRHILWSRWPSSGPPPVFASADHYESLVEALLHAGALLDRGMVYWDIRLSEKQPTLEFRVSDVAATPGEATLLGLLARGLAGLALDDLGAPPPAVPQEVLRGNLWRAARDGIPGCCLHPLTGELVPVLAQLDELVDRVAPVLRETAGDLEFAREELARLRETGGGANRQRAAYARRGRFADIVDLLSVN
ncbi:YbdK family carboxylate-amine ligase, partial [Amycolatopsis rhizosphaerae]